ncbi:unnamed protein product, partial [Ectocarpus sp. 12 AP-2014]
RQNGAEHRRPDLSSSSRADFCATGRCPSVCPSCRRQPGPLTRFRLRLGKTGCCLPYLTESQPAPSQAPLPLFEDCV